MITFPTNPSVGDIYTSGNQSWEWNGTAWVNANTGANFLPLSGGNLSGPLTSSSTITSMGVTNGSVAAAGQVGEVLNSGMSAGVANPSAGATVQQLTLTPGVWLVFAFYRSGNATATHSGWYGLYSAANGTSGTIQNNQANTSYYWVAPSGAVPQGPVGMPLVMNVTASFTVYLNGAATAPACAGQIIAIRIR